MPDYKKLYKECEDEKSDLIDRYKTDSDLFYLVKYVMKDKNGTNVVPDVVNVTLSIPGQFGNDVISMLGTAKEQVIVESEDRNVDTHEIEEFRKAGFGAANYLLRLRKKKELNPWWDFHSCLRGGCAALCAFQMGNTEKGRKVKEAVLVSHIQQWDRGYVNYGVGVNGLDWAGYKTTRRKNEIEAEYGEEITISGKEAEVLDVWHTEGHEVWVGGKKILEAEHKFGFCPVVIETVDLGTMLADKDSLVHEGESIFFLIREAVPELNRLISIMQTLNLKTIKPPKGWASKDGKQEAPDYEALMSSGSITQQEIGGGVTNIDFGDAQRSAQLAYGIMHEAIERATQAAFALGVIESPPASGVRAMIAGESSDRLLSPRLGIKARMNQGLSDMFTAQVIQIGGTVELGTPGHKRKFQTSKLEGQYEAYYKYTIKSAAVDAGRASLAAAYGDAFSEKFKLENVYQVDDPAGEIEQKRVERAERLSPSVRIYRTIVALKKRADEGDEHALFEAQLLAGELNMTVDQLMGGNVGQLPKPEKEDEPTQVLSLFGGGGRAKPLEEGD